MCLAGGCNGHVQVQVEWLDAEQAGLAVACKDGWLLVHLQRHGTSPYFVQLKEAVGLAAPLVVRRGHREGLNSEACKT